MKGLGGGELDSVIHTEKSKPPSSIIQKTAGSGHYSGQLCVATSFRAI